MAVKLPSNGLRVLVLAQDGTPAREIDPALVLSMTRTEEINGDVSASLESLAELEKGERVLVRSADGTWREYEVMGVKAEASDGALPTWTASLVWALYGDLNACMQGALKMPKGPAAALAQVVEGTCWEVGDVGVTGTGAVGMYYKSKWECLALVVDAFGGEVRADIGVSATGIVSRKLSLPSKLGSRTCARRFDWGSDLAAISRSVDEGPVYARIAPRGKGEESGDGYGRRITIADVNGGREWLEDEEAALAFRRPDGKGGWAYPTKAVVNESVDDAAELLEWGKSVLHDYTRPKVTYSASVLQLARAGMDAQGVALGDDVQCVDRGFGEGGLRVEGRVVAMETNELDPTDTKLTIGSIAATLADDIAALRHDVSQVRQAAEGINGGGLDPTGFMARLLERINSEMNATGGYTYLKPGQGIWVYDRAEDQGPTMAVNVVGGGVRVASSKTADGEWDWRTVMTAKDGVVADQVCTGMLKGGSNTWDLSTGDLLFEQGVIRSADGKNYWNLSTGEFSFQGVADEADTIKSVDVEYALGASQSEAPTGGWVTTAPAWQAGKYMWQRTKTVSGTGAALYSDPVCIQGAKGETGAAGADGSDGAPGKDGADGTGISAIQEQYYLSTSSSTQTGGTWGSNQPAWAKGRHYWTRSRVTWSDGSVTYTEPALARGLTSSNQGVSDLDGKLTQAEIFNRLTNNGQTQGVYLQNGKVYINGEYIKAGEIDGSLIKAGTVETDSLVSSTKTLDGDPAMRVLLTSDAAAVTVNGKTYWTGSLGVRSASSDVDIVGITASARDSQLIMRSACFEDKTCASSSKFSLGMVADGYTYYVNLYPKMVSSTELGLVMQVTNNRSGYYSNTAEQVIASVKFSK